MGLINLRILLLKIPKIGFNTFISFIMVNILLITQILLLFHLREIRRQIIKNIGHNIMIFLSKKIQNYSNLTKERTDKGLRDLFDVYLWHIRTMSFDIFFCFFCKLWLIQDSYNNLISDWFIFQHYVFEMEMYLDLLSREALSETCWTATLS